MSMRVQDGKSMGGASGLGSTLAASETGKTGSGAGRAGGAAGGSGDRVEFSGLMANLSRALGDVSASRTGRLDALKTQYQSGRYQPDLQATAHAMISDALGASQAEAG